MIILGIDPGFAALGLARLEVNSLVERAEALAVVRTAKSARKAEVLATSDNARRLAELVDAIAPLMEGVVCIAMEAQSWPRHAGSAVKVALAHGAVIAMARERGIPLVQVSPQDLKRRVTGSRTASKAEVQAALERRFGPLAWPSPASIVGHAADALGAALCATGHPAVMMQRRLSCQR
ncbi:MAG: crossover junction endodeoxyribonuclease RuvC [Polyangia bacterium]|jgi:crossover junction endodeoxyribonuclease RuvC|nr:crossover junction endodeoxyribonuclease RuvC [Polyangia bacterium]